MIKFKTREDADTYNQQVVEYLRNLLGESYKASEYSIIQEVNGEFFMDEHPDVISEIAEYNVSLPIQHEENLEE